MRSPACRRLAWLATLLALCLAPPLHAQRVTERYDATFRKYTKRFFGVGFDWRLFKAQGMTESNLDPASVSWVGAKGIMQLMPSTGRRSSAAASPRAWVQSSTRAACSLLRRTSVLGVSERSATDDRQRHFLTHASVGVRGDSQVAFAPLHQNLVAGGAAGS